MIGFRLMLIGGLALLGQAVGPRTVWAEQEGKKLPLKVVTRPSVKLPQGGNYSLQGVIKNVSNRPTVINSVTQAGSTGQLRFDTTSVLLEANVPIAPQDEVTVKKLVTVQVDKRTPPGRYKVRLDLLGGDAEGNLDPVGRFDLVVEVVASHRPEKKRK